MSEKCAFEILPTSVHEEKKKKNGKYRKKIQAAQPWYSRFKVMKMRQQQLEERLSRAKVRPIATGSRQTMRERLSKAFSQNIRRVHLHARGKKTPKANVLRTY